MPKFRKKPIIVEAVQLTEMVVIKTLEGEMIGEVGDWLITGIKGEKYLCKNDIFQAIYEPVKDENSKEKNPIMPKGTFNF